MEIFVCLETLPEPDCVDLVNGTFDYSDCPVRLDSYSAFALEAALGLKDEYQIPVTAVLLDSFERRPVYDEVKSLGCDSIEWIKFPFSFDPFKRAEYFADALNPGKNDIIIAGYHCETCCTNSIPMLIALNMSLPYHSEVKSVSLDSDHFHLTSFKNDHDIELPFETRIISLRSVKKLRYPSLRDRLACCDEYINPVQKSCKEEGVFPAVSASEIARKDNYTGESEDKAVSLIAAMDSQGMFNI
ncbi:MAG: hypothetical protein PF637_13945 [Spirochaetes bacterium]|jgi:electron transfer flavoprotein alpha/beta subunit|nr:hypothetical protein [Spirochaetota bacterium]